MHCEGKEVEGSFSLMWAEGLSSIIAEALAHRSINSRAKLKLTLRLAVKHFQTNATFDLHQPQHSEAETTEAVLSPKVVLPMSPRVLLRLNG